MASSERKSRKPVFVLFVFGLAAGFFLALDVLIGSIWDTTPQRSFRAAHPFCHHALRPSQEQLTKWGNRWYPMRTNSMGFRDRTNREIPGRTDQPRVVLIGDSMIEGLGVEFEQTCAGMLQSKWEKQRVDVQNAGVVSYSPRLYHLKVRHLLNHVNFEFQHLVVFVDISDTQDELFYRDFVPQVVSEPHWVPRPNWWRSHSLVAKVIDTFNSPQRRVDNQFRTDADINVWMETTKAYSNPDVDPERGRWTWTVDDQAYNEWGKMGLRLASEQMDELLSICRLHNVTVAIVVYPAPLQIFANDRDSRQVKFWSEFCEQHDVEFINLFPEFINYKFASPAEVYRKYFIESDTHWNEAGHRLVADKIDEYLQRELLADD